MYSSLIVYEMFFTYLLPFLNKSLSGLFIQTKKLLVVTHLLLCSKQTSKATMVLLNDINICVRIICEKDCGNRKVQSPNSEEWREME